MRDSAIMRPKQSNYSENFLNLHSEEDRDPDGPVGDHPSLVRITHNACIISRTASQHITAADDDSPHQT